MMMDGCKGVSVPMWKVEISGVLTRYVDKYVWLICQLEINIAQVSDFPVRTGWTSYLRGKKGGWVVTTPQWVGIKQVIKIQAKIKNGRKKEKKRVVGR
jgi:hypothetical protein